MSDQGLLLYNAFLRRVEAAKAEHPHWRLGQTMFNVLDEFDVNARKQIHGTPLDPFYGNETVPDFLAWLKARWNAVS